ncbi:MAG: glycoside hydrolase family 15 protein [Actinomycetota bacterium]
MPRIEDYALIGDLQTAALVSRGGSVDWCCFPRFDSGACFAAMLGTPDNGRWLMAPSGTIRRCTRRYRHDTLILESIYETEEGTVRSIDFMPPRGEAPDIVRIVEGLSGEVPMRAELVIRFDYGHIVPWVRRIDDGLLAIAGPDALCLRSPIETRGEDMTTVSEFTLSPGDRLGFVLTWFPSHKPVPEVTDPERALSDTESYWLDWTAGLSSAGDYREEINSSLIVLKAMTYAPTGGIVAAPTTSLPEFLGGTRNWDYRFCWLRDATLTILAMLKAGSYDEAVTWRQWLLRAVAGDPDDIQIMYGLGGERRLDEREIGWLSGFESSTPVRVGNAASRQLQLDAYGEILDALYQTRVHGAPADDNIWSLTLRLLDWLEDGWRRKDAGIWEVRGPARHFTHSKVMAWVAFDRAVRAVSDFGREGPVERWRALRQEIYDDVLANAWSDQKQSFTQSYGSEELDASVLLMAHVGFMPATDDRFRSTVDAIRRELLVDGLLLRYRAREDGAVDGLAEGEGVFLPCSFWLADVLAMQGDIDGARELFERLLDLRNDVGLLSEEFDTRDDRMLGNFPQAFTHLAIINTAFVLSEGRAMRHPLTS